MKQKTKRRALMAGFTACLMVLSMVCSVLPAGESRALEVEGNDSVAQAVDQGVTYFYTELKEYKNAVEIVGIDAPNGPSTLRIPEKLNGKNVISIYLDFFKYSSYPVTPNQYYAEIPIRKIILPKNIRSLKDSSVTGKWLRLTSLVDMGNLTKLESIETAPGSKYVKAKGGILYSADMKEMIAYPVQNRTKTYKMPSSVTWSAGIWDNPHLKKIIFSKNKKYNNTYAVGGCDNLESIYLPDNITKISAMSFAGCTGLKSIRWSKNLKTIGENAFQNCNALTKVTIPGKVRKIERQAFRWCKNLKKVTLPDSVAYVGSEGFGKTKADLAAGDPKVKIKKASYLYYVKSKKVKKIVSRDPVQYLSKKYISVITITKNGKTKYYDAEGVFYLKPLAKKINLHVKKTKRITVSPDVWEGYMKGWKVKPDILKFTSSNPKVAKVTSKGIVKAQKRGTATITVQMKTSSVKCKVKVTVR